jgi:sodium transport system permease protein
MTFSNVKLILAREVRDQLRDRRTLFMIAVLPIFLYPLLGISMLQVAQFVREQVTKVLVVGADSLARGEGVSRGPGGQDVRAPETKGDKEAFRAALSPRLGANRLRRPSPPACDATAGVGERDARAPALFEGQRFAESSNSARLLELQFAADGAVLNQKSSTAASASSKPADAYTRSEALKLVLSGKCDAALYFPPDFAAKLSAFREAVRHRAEARTAGKAARRRAEPLEVPNPEIIYNAASDKSRIAADRLSDVLGRWTQRIGENNLQTSGVLAADVRPFSVGTSDVADRKCREGAIWAKILPMLLLLWALTGAFYPAIDLCAGEKERGTLETLLSSPAERSEIVLGKLLTVMLFSVATAVLNLASMGITGRLVVSHIMGFGLPPPMAIVAVCVALLPIAALFSALCLALAAFARSTKEGQYYLMPLLLLTMPLVILPMAPGVELNVGNSLIPVTGIVLLLRSVLEGNYWDALVYLPIVAAITLVSCLMAIRWAVEQFNSEEVLFRESERLDLGLWLRRLLRDRRPTPTAAAAGCCAVLILTIQFFMNFSASAPTGLTGLARMILVPQLLVIMPPVLLLTFLLTSSPRETLLLKRPPWLAVPAAALLAVFLHPLANVLQGLVQRLYPISQDVLPMWTKFQTLLNGIDVWSLLLLIAVVPAVCEELAFRGFILSGFRHLGHKRRAIIYSALLFGLTHGILQQSLIASLVGVVLGYIAVQSGSIIPCMVFHCCHNALVVANSRIAPEAFPDWPLLRAFAIPGEEGGCLFTWRAIAAGAMAAFLLLAWFSRLPCKRSPEESLAEAIDHGQVVEMPPAAEEAPFGPDVAIRLRNDAVV